jgi:peptidoglycan/LPS O-acetylase OafA/YrhL
VVEEQFYLFWPFALILARRHIRKALTTLGGTAMLLCASTIVLFPSHGGAVYILPTTWAVTLVIGAAAFIGRDTQMALRRFKAVPLVAAGILLGLCLLPDTKGNSAWFLLLGPLVSVCTVSLIRVVAGWPRLPARWLEPIRRLGVISYCAYLHICGTT